MEDDEGEDGDGVRQRRGTGSGRYKQDVEREVDRIKVKVCSSTNIAISDCQTELCADGIARGKSDASIDHMALSPDCQDKGESLYVCWLDLG